ncbi:MAG: hypothetical protein ACLP0A_15480 [Verrucomicrobiia bacterium]
MKTSKTDVIFLGAGASASAGFPLNEGLANYIIDELPKLKLDPPDDLYLQGQAVRDRWETLRNRWEGLGESLRKTNFLSVDEFCQNAQSRREDVLEMKRMLRLTLFQFSGGWWKTGVEYRRLIDSIFDGPRHLCRQFAVVNFNYDGLFGKLLADAFLERHRSAGEPEPRGDILATVAGGYYNHPELTGVQEPIVAPVVLSETVATDEFVHYMPHGTMGVFDRGENGKLSLLNVIYGLRDEPAKRNALVLGNYFTTPSIRFPWEHGGCMPLGLNEVVYAAVDATRVHFIGLSGHKLMQSSLRNIFNLTASKAEMLLKKQYHVATTANHDVVFDKLLDCILPHNLSADASLRDRLRERLVPYSSFAEWLHKTPHLARV